MKTIHGIRRALLPLALTTLCPLAGCQDAGTLDAAESEDIAEDIASEDTNESASEVESTWSSTWVWYNANDKLQYKTDAAGNRIPDFSYVGYRHGATPPGADKVPAKKTVSPSGGDDTAKIQAAVDAVGAMAKNNFGFRGAVVLNAGTYKTSDPIYVPYDGVVIRGAGAGTVIKSTRSGKDKAVFILGVKNAGDNQWKSDVDGSRSAITSSEVPIGSRSFKVADPGKFDVGDLVVVEHDPKPAWFTAVDDGGTGSDPGWSTLGGFEMLHIRTVTAIQSASKTITVDAPFYMRLRQEHADLAMYKYNSASTNYKVYEKVGIEDLKIDIQTNGGTDEDHTQSAVRFHGVIDGWARKVSAYHFSESGFYITRSTRISVLSCVADDPVSEIEGGKRYNFNAGTGAQQILIKGSTAGSGRHGFVSNGGVSASGIVVVGGTLKNNYTGSEGHRHWTTGMLFDSSKVESLAGGPTNGFCAFNRGDAGTSHGWGSANSVLWNIDAVEGTRNVVQKPPSAQNYAIGVDHATGMGLPAGVIEGLGKGDTLDPPSLYAAQRADRLAP